jgi:prolyl oligopeptidase
MERVPEQIDAQIVSRPSDSPFFAPLAATQRPGEQDWNYLRREATWAIQGTVVPAFQRLQTFFTTQYLPACRVTIGAWDFPDGAAYYDYRVRTNTGIDLTAEEIHLLGLQEVSRIRRAMEDVIVEVGYPGSFAEFIHFLRTDPSFYYEDPLELLEAYALTCKKIEPELVRLFNRLPRTPYGLRPIPDTIAPHTTTAYYSRPAADGSRAGYFYVNLYRPEVRPKYEIEVLSAHEAVPGHHLQIALAMELEELPRFRRYGGYTAFTEGWGLYAESLGADLGLYQDPYSRFGQLTYEMWRAVRLVVDTGIHHLKWDRQRAIDYFMANAAKTEHDITNEIDRYIGWPGQALAYKIGELKIMELRERARTLLMDRFDLAGFHDVVLLNGAVPLSVLEQQVDGWIVSQLPPAPEPETP